MTINYKCVSYTKFFKCTFIFQVFGILEQMPKLKFVNLSFNVLSTPLREVEVDKGMKWQELRNLVLNSTYIGWDSVQDILDHLPCLRELHLSLNGYKDVSLNNESCACVVEEKNDNESPKCPCPIYKTKHKHCGIKILHFNGNLIEDWREVTKLGYAFPNLETLVLADCPIKSLDVNSETEENTSNRNYERSESECESCSSKESPHDSFRNLKIINLNSTQVASWTDLERLSKFPQLDYIRVQVRIFIF